MQNGKRKMNFVQAPQNNSALVLGLFFFNIPTLPSYKKDFKNKDLNWVLAYPYTINTMYDYVIHKVMWNSYLKCNFR